MNAGDEKCAKAFNKNLKLNSVNARQRCRQQQRCQVGDNADN